MGHAEMQKLDPSLGKSIDLNCRRKLEDPGNLGGTGQLRVDDHGKPQFFPQKSNLIIVDRIADTGDGLTMSRLFRNDTAQKVLFIGSGHGDQQISMVNAGLGQCLEADTISYDAHGIQIIRDGIHFFLICINYGDIVIFTSQLFYQGVAYFAAAHNDNVHKYPPK